MSIIKQSKSTQDIQVNSTVVVREGFCPIALYEIQQRYFDDSWSPIYRRELVIKPKAVGALSYDPRLDQVVLIEQFRPGALGGKNLTPWLIEIVAGVMDQKHQESDEELIKREMQEESGLEIEELLMVYDYFTSPGYSTERVKLFCAKVDATKAAQYCGLRQEHEDIKIHRVSTTEAFAAVRSGQINNGLTIIALQWLELNLAKVNQGWL